MPHRVWQLPPDGFAELRRSCILSRKACADLLGCSLSAVKAWDRGTHRVPWSAVKLLRLFRLGDLGTLRPEWRGWTINRNGLVSPEGLAYARADLGWWSLTCRQAEAFRQRYDNVRGAQRPSDWKERHRATLDARSERGPLGEPPAGPVQGPGASLPAASRRMDVAAELAQGKAPEPGGASAASEPGAGLVPYTTTSTETTETASRRGLQGKPPQPPPAPPTRPPGARPPAFAPTQRQSAGGAP